MLVGRKVARQAQAACLILRTAPIAQLLGLRMNTPQGLIPQHSLIDRSPVSNQARSSYKWVQTLQTDVRESLQLHCEKSYTQMAHDVPQERLDQNLCSGAR